MVSIRPTGYTRETKEPISGLFRLLVMFNMKQSRSSPYKTYTAPPRMVARPHPVHAQPRQAFRLGRRTRRRKGPDLAIIMVLAGSLAALLFLPLGAAVGLYAYFQVFERILPGVHVGKTRLSGMSVEQATIELHKTWNLEHSIMVSDGIKTLQVPPSTLGLSVDAWLTASAAYRVGHEQPILVELDQMIYSVEKGWGIQPLLNFDPDEARAGLEMISGQISKPPRNAVLQLQGRTLVAVPGELGYTINIEETLSRLASDPHGVYLGESFQVVLKPVTPHITDVSEAMVEAQRLLDTPLTIRAYDPIFNEWLDLPVSPESVAGWLKIETDEQGPQVSIDSNRVADYLTSLEATLDQGRWVDASRYAQPFAEAVRAGDSFTLQLNHKATKYIIQPGDTMIKIGWKVGMPYWKLLQANPGMNPDAMWAGQEIVVPSKDELLPLPVVANKRIVISISEQRLWAYQDGSLLSEHIISTGIDRSPTQPGIFQVQTHEINAYASVWDLHMPNFLGIYEAWPGFMNGIHGLPTLSNGRRLWANVLGRPASYGCIILNLDAAEWLYNWAEDGVIVEIQA